MKYNSKGYVFDEEVTAWLDKLKSMHGSYNKGLRLVAFPAEGRGAPAIDVPAALARIPKSKSLKSKEPEPALTKALETVLPQNEPQKGAIDLGNGRKIWERK